MAGCEAERGFLSPTLGLALLLPCLGLALTSCARPEGMPRVLGVPGAPEGCRASWVLAGPTPRDAAPGDPFAQREGQLEGAAFGACALVGPAGEGRWMWVLMSFEPAFRGEIVCRAGGRRSPRLAVGGPEVVAPAGVKVDLSGMDAVEMEAAERGVVPSSAGPCGVGG